MSKPATAYVVCAGQESLALLIQPYAQEWLATLRRGSRRSGTGPSEPAEYNVELRSTRDGTSQPLLLNAKIPRFESNATDSRSAHSKKRRRFAMHKRLKEVLQLAQDL
jgi:hypothetical protein